MDEKYIVVHNFKDLEDNEHVYLASRNDIYPRKGLKPTKARIKELTSEKNKIGKILIKKIEEPVEDVKEETEVTE